MSKLSRKIKRLKKHNGILRIENFYEGGSIGGMLNNDLRAMKLSKLMEHLYNEFHRSDYVFDSLVFGKHKSTKVWVEYYTFEQKKARFEKRRKNLLKNAYAKYNYSWNIRKSIEEILKENNDDMYLVLMELDETIKKMEIIF